MITICCPKDAPVLASAELSTHASVVNFAVHTKDRSRIAGSNPVRLFPAPTHLPEWRPRRPETPPQEDEPRFLDDGYCQAFGRGQRFRGSVPTMAREKDRRLVGLQPRSLQECRAKHRKRRDVAFDRQHSVPQAQNCEELEGNKMLPAKLPIMKEKITVKTLASKKNRYMKEFSSA